jgi:hypothetical protein
VPVALTYFTYQPNTPHADKPLAPHEQKKKKKKER